MFYDACFSVRLSQGSAAPTQRSMSCLFFFFPSLSSFACHLSLFSCSFHVWTPISCYSPGAEPFKHKPTLTLSSSVLRRSQLILLFPSLLANKWKVFADLPLQKFCRTIQQTFPQEFQCVCGCLHTGTNKSIEGAIFFFAIECEKKQI